MFHNCYYTCYVIISKSLTSHYGIMITECSISKKLTVKPCTLKSLQPNQLQYTNTSFLKCHNTVFEYFT